MPSNHANQPQTLEGRYRLVAEIASGAMGRVYHAVDLVTGRPVAAKMLLSLGENDPDALLRFYQEGAMLCTLKHPNIVRVHAAFAQEEEACLIMELLEGQTLAQILRQERLSLARAKRLGRQIAAGLAYAHGRSIIHRDIKPANIMIVDNDQVKVTDFGIARILRSGAMLSTRTNVTLGTPLYMSPEQITGQVVDARSDIYSLGIVLYQMVTGHAPFQADDPMSVAYMQVHDSPEPPSHAIADLPPVWDTVILTALAKDPNDRFSSAADLEKAIAGLPSPEEESLSPVRSKVPHAGEMAVEERKRSEQTLALWKKAPIASSVSPPGASSQETIPPSSMESDSPGSGSRIGSSGTLSRLSANGGRYGTLLALSLALLVAITLWSIVRTPTATSVRRVETTATAEAEKLQGLIVTLTAGPAATATAQTQATRAARNGGYLYLAAPLTGVLTVRNPIHWARVHVQNFTATAQFHVPSAGATGRWNAGLLFRYTSGNSYYRLLVSSNKRFVMELQKSGTPPHSRAVASGSIPNLRTGYGAINTLRLEVKNNSAWIFVNGSYMGTLDTSSLQTPGDVGVGMGPLPDAVARQNSVQFVNFTIFRYEG